MVKAKVKNKKLKKKRQSSADKKLAALIAKGKPRGFVTEDEIAFAFPPGWERALEPLAFARNPKFKKIEPGGRAQSSLFPSPEGPIFNWMFYYNPNAINCQG